MLEGTSVPTPARASKDSIEPYRGSSDDFTAVGDAYGLFIINIFMNDFSKNS
jgi:hypothetical protein